jgi:hypothetical protein
LVYFKDFPLTDIGVLGLFLAILLRPLTVLSPKDFCVFGFQIF